VTLNIMEMMDLDDAREALKEAVEVSPDPDRQARISQLHTDTALLLAETLGIEVSELA
jgi:hypothetical protein